VTLHVDLESSLKPFIEQPQIDAIGLEKATSRTSSFDEAAILRTVEKYISRQLAFQEVKVTEVDGLPKNDNAEVQKAVEIAEPGKPTFVFANL
jgi:hypothetical protein